MQRIGFQRTITIIVASLVLTLANQSFAQGVRFVVGGPGGPGGPFGRDAMGNAIEILGDLNLSPNFNLSAEQKQKVQSIRDDFKQATDAWRKDHADELKQLDDQQKELFEQMQNGGGPPDPNQMMELMEQRRQLMDTAPNGEDHVKQIQAVLTPEQQKQYDEKKAAVEKERREAMEKMPPMRINMGGAGGGMTGGPPPQKDSDQDKDKDKENKSKDGKGK